MRKRLTQILAFFVLAAGVSACNDSDFAGDADKAKAESKSKSPKDPGGTTATGGPTTGKATGGGATGGTGGGSTGNGGSDGSGSGSKGGLGNGSGSNSDGLGSDIDAAGSGSEGELGFDETEMKILPKPCNGANQVVIGVGAKCPAAMAMYTMDDMSKNSSVPSSYVCCGLPSGDVLSKKPAEVHQTRSRTCGAGEVMTGVVDGNGNVMCTRINLERYQLAPAKLVCAGEEGVFGFGGKTCGGSAEIVNKDSLPANIVNLVIGPLGADGCVSVPFGSLVTRQGGRRCEDSAAMTLIYKDNGQPVPMFP